MSGIGATLSIAKTAIAAQQYGLAVTGHNIANVNNPDYSMQVADQLNRTPALYGGFLFVDVFFMSKMPQTLNEEEHKKAREAIMMHVRKVVPWALILAVATGVYLISQVM